MKRKALDDLKADISQRNAASGKNYEIMDVSEVIHYGDPKIEILDGAKV